MKKKVIRRILAGGATFLLSATLITWVTSGAGKGWSKTEITELQRDDITGIDYPVTRRGFVAGLDFLAIGSGAALLLAASALLLKGSPKSST